MGDPQSMKIMKVVDRLSPTNRQLVYEYGVVIVTRFLESGYRGKQLRYQLEIWRRNQQERWLNN